MKGLVTQGGGGGSRSSHESRTKSVCLKVTSYAHVTQWRSRRGVGSVLRRRRGKAAAVFCLAACNETAAPLLPTHCPPLSTHCPPPLLFSPLLLMLLRSNSSFFSANENERRQLCSLKFCVAYNKRQPYPTATLQLPPRQKTPTAKKTHTS